MLQKELLMKERREKGHFYIFSHNNQEEFQVLNLVLVKDQQLSKSQVNKKIIIKIKFNYKNNFIESSSDDLNIH